MRQDLVIARFHENLDWVDQLSNKFNIVIYNKGINDINKNYNIITLKNIGREASSYLQYIVDNYEDLPEEIVFTSGHPFDTCKRFIELMLKDNFYYESELEITDRVGFANIDSAVKFHDNFIGYGNIYYNDDYITYHTMDSMNLVYPSLFKDEQPSKFTFSVSAIFRVTKDGILANSKEFYKFALEISNNDRGHYWYNPHAFERIWPIIFNVNSNTHFKDD